MSACLSPSARAERSYGAGAVAPGGLGSGRGDGVRLAAQGGRARAAVGTGRGEGHLQVRMSPRHPLPASQSHNGLDRCQSGNL